VLAAGVALALLAGAAPTAAPARPPACHEIADAAELSRRLAGAVPGDALCLAPGSYPGPLRIGASVTLWGPRDAVIRSNGAGTTVRIESDGAALLGVTVDGSGSRYDLLDAAVHVQGADVRVEGVRIVNAVYGLLVERSERALLRGNEVAGDPGRMLGLRGDGLRLWEVKNSRVEANRVSDSRDCVVWYSPGNRIVGNRIERGRYGVHFMYSHDNQIADNDLIGNVTGIFIMYSRRVDVTGNRIGGSTGAAGIGLGLKESGPVRVADNRLVDNTIGIHVDMSPLDPGDRNEFERNELSLGDVGIEFMGPSDGNTLRGNALRDNALLVRVAAGGEARPAHWRGNYFDDYSGYDLDEDGTGDVPYELRSLSSELQSRVPALAFFRGTPALALAEAIGRIVPIFEPRLLVVDPSPRMRPPGEGRRAD
jgi:nitrous oxidase accessory protein